MTSLKRFQLSMLREILGAEAGDGSSPSSLGRVVHASRGLDVSGMRPSCVHTPGFQQFVFCAPVPIGASLASTRHWSFF